MAAEKALMFCETLMENFPGADKNKYVYTFTPVCQNVLTATRIGFFLAMIACNALMWTCFTKALRLSATTLEATIINTAANFLFTAVYGQVFFGETVTRLWWLGTALIMAGLSLMHKAEDDAIEARLIENAKKKKK
ncbi:Transmembrane protein 42 like protein [Argiope bruennichi]|uniref:Transmembrane protein 42 like protein n=2 Tax=Argiope bruennichi TaxID=94029 RepID=A0A8T0F9Y3_ARGBR|nr:Transmembrane protein 42 like protein [Argiope bruennichi]